MAHILVVEDSLTQALRLQMLLEQAGHQVSVAHDGQQGIASVVAAQPDLVISDITMPIMDGFTLCRAIKSEPQSRGVPVILLTNLTDPNDIIHGLNAQADGYVTKPYEDHFILSQVSHMLALLPAEDEIATDRQGALDIEFNGTHHQISANRRQILNLFLSTYNNALLKNRALELKQRQLNEVNDRLKSKMVELQDSEDRFSHLVETIPDIVYRLDSSGHFIFLNEAIGQFGYQQDELLGKHFSSLLLTEDLPRVSHQHLSSSPHRRGGEPGSKLFDERRTGARRTTGLEITLAAKQPTTSVTGELHKQGGGALVVEVSSSGIYSRAVAEPPHYIGTVGVIRDITERKQVQRTLEDERAFLQTLISSLPVPVYYKDLQGVFKLVNDNFLRLLGKQHAQVIGRSLFDFLPDGSAGAIHFREQLFLNSEQEREVLEGEYIFDNAANKRTMVLSMAKFYTASGELAGVIGAMIDISERIFAEQEMDKARQTAEAMARRAEEASRTKSAFLANMSHEIRTPMNAIIGLTNLVLDSELSSKQQAHLRRVNSAANILLGLINDVLDYSKIEAGRLELESTEVDLLQIIEEVSELVEQEAMHKQLELLLDIDMDIPTPLYGDPLRLRQILINLLNNAIKFTQTGAVELIAECLRSGEPSIELRITVRDSGIGMSPQQLSGLFHAFSQADSSTTRRFGGTGLGLTISRRLVEAMGGALTVVSQEGVGTSFSFTITLARVTGSATPLRPLSELQGTKILVVDQPSAGRELLLKMLRQLRFEVSIAEMDADLLGEAQKLHPAVVLMGRPLPADQGLSLAHALSAIGAKVVLVADNSQVLDPLAPFDRAFAAVVAKPIYPSRLWNTIASALGFVSNPNLSSHLAPYQPPQFGPLRVLVCEDNEFNQILITELLQQRGLLVTMAQHGAEGVALLQQSLAAGEPYNMVLMDVQMPVMDGYEATQQIRSLPELAHLPVVAMTANAMQEDRDRCLVAGMDAHISKPIDLVAMDRVLSRFLLPPDPPTDPQPDPPIPPRSRHLPARLLLISDDPDMVAALVMQLQRLDSQVDVMASGRDWGQLPLPARPDMVVIAPPCGSRVSAALITRLRALPLLSQQPYLELVDEVAAEQQALADGLDGVLLSPSTTTDLVATLEYWMDSRLSTRPTITCPIEVLDVAGGLKRLGGNEGLYHELVTRFVSRISGDLQQLQQLLAAGEWALLQASAHSAAGVAANISATTLFLDLNRLQSSALAEQPEEAAAVLAAIQQDIQRLVEAIEYQHQWQAEEQQDHNLQQVRQQLQLLVEYLQSGNIRATELVHTVVGELSLGPCSGLARDLVALVDQFDFPAATHICAEIRRALDA